MFDVQYHFFRDLDRRCVAGGLEEAQCAAVVELKRKAIDSALNRSNPLAAAVLEGRTTFVAVYDEFSRAFRGVRRFVPKSHDAAWNERLEQLAQIIPNVRHFRRRSVFAADNPTTLALYGAIVGAGVAAVLAGGEEVGEAPALPWADAPAALVLGGALLGVGFGTAAMFKYRIRDYQHIHAREAAGYMDLNYGFFRSGDQRGWIECLRAEAAEARAKLARPD